MPADPYDLGRFVAAQAGTYSQALAELRAGRKHSHWMWFIFPQLAGLGHSPTARHYAIATEGEARAYLGHAVLGPRLLECCATLLAVKDRTAHEIFGNPDDLKLRSCMTLFAQACPDQLIFQQVMDKLFDGRRDSRTLGLLK